MTAPRLGRWDWLALAFIVAQAGAAVFVLQRGLTGVLPIVFDTQGEVSRWGDRRDVAVLIGACAVLSLVVHVVLRLLGAWTRARGRDASGFDLARLVIFLAIGLLAGLLCAIGLGWFYWTGAPQA